MGCLSVTACGVVALYYWRKKKTEILGGTYLVSCASWFVAADHCSILQSVRPLGPIHSWRVTMIYSRELRMTNRTCLIRSLRNLGKRCCLSPALRRSSRRDQQTPTTCLRKLAQQTTRTGRTPTCLLNATEYLGQ